MLNDYELKRLNEKVVKIYQDMELDMLNKLGEFLDQNDKIGGSAEWHIKKLEEISNLNGDLARTASKYANKSEKEVKKMLQDASIANFVVEDLDGVTLDKLKNNKYVLAQLDYFQNDLGHNLAKIRTNTINATKEQYLAIVDKATLETSSGTKSFSQSITDALKELGDKGITGQIYERSNGDRVRYSAEGLVRRDTISAAFGIANRSFLEQAEELGIDYVYVSQHLGARTSEKSKIANHAGWQGKIYKLNGKDEKYDNFVEETGYGTVEGFGGVNCRHRVSMATAGMNIPEQIDQEENAKMEALQKEQRYMERCLREWKRKATLFKSSGNKEEYKKAKEKVNEWVDKLDAFCKKHGLRRDYTRERIS